MRDLADLFLMGKESLHNLKLAAAITMIIAVAMLTGLPKYKDLPKKTPDCIEISAITIKDEIYKSAERLNTQVLNNIKSILKTEQDPERSDNILANSKVIYLANFDLGLQLDNFPDIVRQCPQNLSCELTDLSDNISVMQNRINAAKRNGKRLGSFLKQYYSNDSFRTLIHKYHRLQSKRLKDLPDYYSDCIKVL